MVQVKLWKTAFKNLKELKAVFHKFYLIHFWIICPKYKTGVSNKDL